jgi:uncharacterized protein (TIGR02452 family)
MMNTNQKQERKIAAEKHIREMAKAHAEEIAACVKNSTIYARMPEAVSSEKRDTEIFVYRATAQEVLKSRYPKDERVCVLNFASYKNPGGGYANGSMAQEESLCRDSFLYNVLNDDRFDREFYSKNLADTNHSLYRDRGIYSPDILFFEKYRADVLTCAAPNVRAYREHTTHVLAPEIWKNQKSRIRFVLRVAKEQHADVLILGAFGCGVFGNDASDIADVFSGYLLEDAEFSHAFSKVYFAVPDPGQYTLFRNAMRRKQ